MATIDVSAYTSLQDALDSTVQGANGDTFTFPDGYSETLTGTIDCTTYASAGSLADPTKFVQFKALGSCDITTSNSFGTTSEALTGRYVYFEGIDFKGPTPGSYIGLGVNPGYYSYYYLYNCSFTDMATGVTSNRYAYMDSVRFEHCQRALRGYDLTWVNGLATNQSEIYANSTYLWMQNCVVDDPRYSRWDASSLVANQCTFYRPGTASGTLFFQSYGYRQISDCIFSGFSMIAANNNHSDMFHRCSRYGGTGTYTGVTPIAWDVETLSSDPLPNAPTNFIPADVGSVLNNNQPSFGGVMPSYSFRGAVPGASSGGGASNYSFFG